MTTIFAALETKCNMKKKIMEPGWKILMGRENEETEEIKTLKFLKSHQKLKLI